MAAALLILGLLGGWELLVCAGGVDPLLLPAPTQVVSALWNDRSLLAPDLAVTVWEAAVGLAAAIALRVALAVAMHLWGPVRKAPHRLVVGSQAIPMPVLAPVLILALGFGLGRKVLRVALVCFFPVPVN